MSFSSLEIALSPCPNDVFIVSGLLLKKIDSPLKLNFYFEDIETLNHWAINKKYPVIKTSFAIWNYLFNNYYLSCVGSAMGFGVGPLLVGKNLYSKKDFPELKIAIPGEHTTAHFLFNFFYKGPIKKIFVKYSEIIPYILENKSQLGILIHEGRFVHSSYKLIKLADLGAFWEEKTKTPIPLGGFFIKKDLPDNIKNCIISLFKQSLNWAKTHWNEVLPLLKKYAQELDNKVIEKHVNTYVNDYTSELKDEALKALEIFKNYLNIKKPLKDLIWRI